MFDKILDSVTQVKENLFCSLTRHLENDKQAVLACSQWEEIQVGMAGLIFVFVAYSRMSRGRHAIWDCATLKGQIPLGRKFSECGAVPRL